MPSDKQAFTVSNEESLSQDDSGTHANGVQANGGETWGEDISPHVAKFFEAAHSALQSLQGLVPSGEAPFLFCKHKLDEFITVQGSFVLSVCSLQL